MIITEASDLCPSTETSIQNMMRILRLIMAAIPGVQWAQFHMRALQSFMLSIWDGKKENTQEIKLPVRWWLNAENLSAGHLWSQHLPVTVTTDECGRERGAHMGNQMVQGVWSNQLARLSSNAKELKALQKAFPDRKTHTSLFGQYNC